MNDSVRLDIDDRGVARVTMHRPDRHNAFDAAMIAALDTTFTSLEAADDIRVIVLTGSGPTFCSGADLTQMRAMLGATEHENYEDALRLARLLRRLADLGKPFVARINGNAFGGAIGLIACADIAVATTTARLALSEIRLGLVPATISPYVLEAIGKRAMQRLTLTGERFTSEAAAALGLVHVVVEPAELDAAVEQQIGWLLAGAPGAQREAKRLLRRLRGVDRSVRDEREIHTARLLAQIRVGAEAQEGMSAFLDKRRPRWMRG